MFNEQVMWEIACCAQLWPNITSLESLINTVCTKKEIPKMDDEQFKSPTLRQVITECLSFEASRRPKVETILSSIPLIILEHSMKDDNAIKFWKSKFVRDTNVRENVQFEVFVEELWKWLGIGEPEYDSDHAIALQHLLGSFFRFKISFIRKTFFHLNLVVDGEVNYVKFGEIMQKFGPLEKGMKTLDKILTTFKLKYFHGEISSEKANSMLKKQGDFLVRFSNNHPACFIIHVVSHKEILQIIVKHFMGVGYKLLQSKESYFDSLSKLITNYKSKFGFKNSVSNKELKSVFEKKVVKSGGYKTVY